MMASFMHQEQVMMSGKPTQAVPASSTDPNDDIFDANNVLQDLFSGPETFSSQVTDKLDPTLRTRDELYEDMQELFKDEAEAFGELHELHEFNELDGFHELDELLKPINSVNEEQTEFISNSSEPERLIPAKPEEKELEAVQQCPVQVSSQHVQTPYRQTKAVRCPAQSSHRPVRQTHLPLQGTQVSVQATPRPVHVSRRPAQVTHLPQQAIHHPAQGCRRPPKQSCPPVQVSEHRPPKAPCRPVQASNRGPPQAPCRPVQASHQRPPKVPYQPVQVSNRRPPKVPTRPVRASQHPSPAAPRGRVSQRPAQASQYAAPPAPYTQASRRAVPGSISVDEVTAEQILEYLRQPPVTNVPLPDMTASMMTGGHLVPNPSVLQQTPPSVVSPSDMSATLTVGGHPIPSSGDMHQMNHVAADPTNMNGSVVVRNHLVPRSGVMHQPHIPLMRNVNASAMPVDPRVRSSRNPGYENVNHGAMSLGVHPQMVHNPNVPVMTSMVRGSQQEIPHSQGSGMNQYPMRGQSGLKRKLRQEHPRVVRKRTPEPNGATFIPGSAPLSTPQTPAYAIPVQQIAYSVPGGNFNFASGQGNPLQPAYAINGGVATPTRAQGQPVQQNARAANNSQMRPPRPRRKTRQNPAGNAPAGNPSPRNPPPGKRVAESPPARQIADGLAPDGQNKSTKPTKAVKLTKEAKAPTAPTASKPPRAPRGGKAAQNAAKRKAEAPADETERPKKRTRTRIEDLDPAAVHVCDYEGCTKKFAKKYNLKIHQRRHSGDLPFTCDHEGCEKRFMWLSSFSRHSRVHKSKGKGGRKKREPKAETPQDVDITPAEEPDIAIADSYSIFSVGRLQHLVENEKSDQVTTACSLTALDAKPCQNLVPASKNAQSQRQNYLCGARAEEFYRYLTTPYQVEEPQLGTFCDVLTAATDPDRYMQDPTAFVNI